MRRKYGYRGDLYASAEWPGSQRQIMEIKPSAVCSLPDLAGRKATAKERSNSGEQSRITC